MLLFSKLEVLDKGPGLSLLRYLNHGHSVLGENRACKGYLRKSCSAGAEQRGTGAGELAQWLKGPSAKSNDLSSASQAPGENLLQRCPWTSTCTPYREPHP